MNNGHNNYSTNTPDKLLVWKKPTWLQVFTLYQRLLEYLTHDVKYVLAYPRVPCGFMCLVCFSHVLWSDNYIGWFLLCYCLFACMYCVSYA
jgi:hypothetical protein